ncbi:MAG: caspase family protein, partial [Gammaproteobacteria bacterium]|nr:caspase family protein [Gammaproteobacteria bacterium]
MSVGVGASTIAWIGAIVHRVVLAIAIALLPSLAPAQQSAPAAKAAPVERRIALVIGNARYAKFPLGNPENDARLIAGNLRRLGFEVDERLNLNVLQFRRALREFAREVQKDDAVSVFYYAGHGVQIDGRNYLLPVDINLRDEEEVKDESVDIDELFLSRIEKARSHPRIVILDACRNNPFVRKTRNVRTAGGLAEMGARGTLIAFASAPGAPAEDGPDGSNSVYTRHLAQEMMVPGLEVEPMFKNVRVKVLRETQERQLPWVNTSLTSNFSFNPGQVDARAAVRSGGEARTNVPPRNELEQQLELAQKRLDQERAAVREQAAVPKQPEVQEKAAVPVQVAAQRVSRPEPSLAVPPARAALGAAEVQSLLVGKTHTFAADGPGQWMHWDLRSGGLIYYNSRTTSGFAANGSGRWRLGSDGSLCARFNPVPPGPPSDARRPEDGCWLFYRDGDKLMRQDARGGSP